MTLNIPKIPLPHPYRILACHVETEFPLGMLQKKTAPPVLVSRNIAKLATDEQGNRYDYGEQFTNARDVLNAWWKPEIIPQVIEEIKSNNDGKVPPTISIVLPLRTKGWDRVNTLSISYAWRLQRHLQAELDRDGIKTNVIIVPLNPISNTTGRTVANALCRLIARTGYEKPPGIEPGDCVVFADEHIQNGRSALDICSYVSEWGAKVVGITSLSRNPETYMLGMEPEVGEELKSLVTKLGETDPQAEAKFNKILDVLELSFETLTSRDAMTLMAYLMPRNPEYTERFTKLMSALRRGETSYQGPDDLMKVFHNYRTSLDVLLRDMGDYKSSLLTSTVSVQGR